MQRLLLVFLGCLALFCMALAAETEDKKVAEALKKLKDHNIKIEAFFEIKKVKHVPVNPKKINPKILKGWGKLVAKSQKENEEKRKKMMTLADPKPTDVDWGI